MKDNLVRYSLRIEGTLLDKLGYVAEYEGRSANSQVLYLIGRCVADFKKHHGEIEIEPPTAE